MLKQLIAIVVAVTLGVGLAWYAVQWRLNQTEVTSATAVLPSGGDFTLHGLNGPVSLADYRGKVVVLYFGYTACPDICPTSMATLKGALNALKPEEAQQIQGIFISVDPERDTVERLQQYATYFHPSIAGITGSAQEIAKVAGQYGVIYRKVPTPGSAMGYTIDHSASLFIVDKQGKVQAEVPHATPPLELAELLRKWL